LIPSQILFLKSHQSNPGGECILDMSGAFPHCGVSGTSFLVNPPELSAMIAITEVR